MVYILVISQLWAGTIMYCHWVVDCETELIELFGSEDGEAEESEKEKKEEKVERLRHLSEMLNDDSLLNLARFNHAQRFLPIVHQEIITPPPEYI